MVGSRKWVVGAEDGAKPVEQPQIIFQGKSTETITHPGQEGDRTNLSFGRRKVIKLRSAPTCVSIFRRRDVESRFLQIHIEFAFFML